MIFTAFVYAAWHPSDYRASLGEDWTEWNLVRDAKPRFPGHRVGQMPLGGAYDDSRPEVAARQARTAVAFGVDVFVFNFYWSQGPVLANGLTRGFLRADTDRLKFALNLCLRLPRTNLPLALHSDDNVDRNSRTWKPTRQEWEECTIWMARECARDERYWRVGGRPVLYLFPAAEVVESFGGVDGFREASARLTSNFASLGLKRPLLIGCCLHASDARQVQPYGLDVLTSYNPLPRFDSFSVQSYADGVSNQQRVWAATATLGSEMPYWPTVSLGFDASPRGAWVEEEYLGQYTGYRYPWFPIVAGFTEKLFEGALRAACYTSLASGSGVVNLCAWNEWSEGCALEPGDLHRHGPLAAVKRVKDGLEGGESA